MLIAFASGYPRVAKGDQDQEFEEEKYDSSSLSRSVHVDSANRYVMFAKTSNSFHIFHNWEIRRIGRDRT